VWFYWAPCTESTESVHWTRQQTFRASACHANSQNPRISWDLGTADKKVQWSMLQWKMLQLMNATMNDATMNKRYNERMLQQTVFINKIRMLKWTKMLQRMNSTINYATMNKCYNERMLQQTLFISKIRMLKWTKMLQRTWRNTIGRRSTLMHMTCRASLLWLQHHSSSLLSFVTFSYQFSPVSCLFVQSIKGK
jgi:ribosomal protein L22